MPRAFWFPCNRQGREPQSLGIHFARWDMCVPYRTEPRRVDGTARTKVSEVSILQPGKPRTESAISRVSRPNPVFCGWGGRPRIPIDPTRTFAFTPSIRDSHPITLTFPHAQPPHGQRPVRGDPGESAGLTTNAPRRTTGHGWVAHP